MIDESRFLSKESFAKIIEDKVLNEGFTYFQAVIDYCEEFDREIDDVTNLMMPVLLEKVRQSARDIGLMPKEPSLEDIEQDE